MKKWCVFLVLAASVVALGGEKQIKLIGPDDVLDKIDSLTIEKKEEPEPPPVPEGTVPHPDETGCILLMKPGVYTLDRDITDSIWVAAPNVHLNLNGHTVSTVGPGVRLYVSWADNNKFGPRQAPQGFRLTGPGRIESERGDAVSGRRGYDCVLENATLVCNAPDTGCVSFGSLSFTARGLTCISNIPSVANRHQLPSVIKSSNSCLVENCVVIGGQVGIFCPSGSTIRNNFISQNSVATNGYAIASHKANKAVIENNLIVVNNGRGVLLNHGTNNVVKDNLIFARERPNKEYGTILNPCGIRIRYSANNNTVTGNNCLAISMPGYTAGSGLYLTNDPGVSNVFRDNTFAAVLATDYLVGARYGKAVTLEAQGRFNQGTNQPAFNHDIIDDNRFVSNHICLSLSGRDGYKNGAHMSNPLKGNTFIRKPGEEIVSDFFTAAAAKLPDNPFAKERFDEIVASIDGDYFDPEKGWDIWTEERWRTPVTITVEGNQGLRIRRNEYAGFRIDIRVVP